MDYPDFVDAGFQKYWVEKNYAEANDLFLRAIELNPRGVKAIGYLADSYRMQGDLESALFYARRAVVLAPKSAAAHGTLGVVLGGLGHYKEALEELDKALEKGPDAGLYAEAAKCKFRLGDLKGAVKLADLALQRRPNSQTALWVKEQIATTNVGLSASTLVVGVRESMRFTAAQDLKIGEEMVEQGNLGSAYMYLGSALRIRETSPKARTLIRKLFRNRGLPQLFLLPLFLYMALRPSPSLAKWVLAALVFFAAWARTGQLMPVMVVLAAILLTAITSTWLLNIYIAMVEHVQPKMVLGPLFGLAGDLSPSVIGYGMARGERGPIVIGASLFACSVLVMMATGVKYCPLFKGQYSGLFEKRSNDNTEKR